MRWTIAACVLLVPALAHAQAAGGGMPDLKAMAGRPLPVADMPVGSVSIRVARQMPVNAAAGVKVTATLQVPNADAMEVELETGADGRANFESLSPGAEFQAEATVDGELLRTSKVVIPARGGLRMMLIAGIGATPPATTEPALRVEPAEDRSRFDIDAVSGTVEPAADEAAGTVAVALVDGNGKPITKRPVFLASVRKSGEVTAHEGETDATGTARLTNLATDQDAIYMAVAEIDRLRLGTRPFNLSPERGVRVRIAPPAMTSDPSVLIVDETSKLIIEPREEYVFIATLLSFRNTSDKIYDPGLEGHLIPLPTEFTGAQGFGGGATIEIIKDVGVLMRQRIMPHVPHKRSREEHAARFGFMLPHHGEDRLEVGLAMPQGMKAPLVLVPASTRLSIEATGLKTLPEQSDREGNPVQLFELPDVPAGGTLRFTVTGLPVVPRTGRRVAAALAVGLAVWGFLGFRRPRNEAREKRERRRQELIGRRENLFRELVDMEERRRGDGAQGGESETGGGRAGKRAEVVRKLEDVYRDLSDLEGT